MRSESEAHLEFIQKHEKIALFYIAVCAGIGKSPTIKIENDFFNRGKLYLGYFKLLAWHVPQDKTTKANFSLQPVSRHRDSAGILRLTGSRNRRDPPRAR